MSSNILTGLGQIRVPSGSGLYLRRLLEELNRSLEVDAPGTAFRCLRNCFRCLVELCTGVADSVCVLLGGFSFLPPGREFESISETVAALNQALQLLCSDDFRDREIAGLILAIFFKDFQAKVPIPYEHTSLLGVAGHPPSNMLKLYELCEWQPQLVRVKADRKYFQYELRRYIPILRQWLEVLNAFWEVCPITGESIDLDGRYRVTYELGGLEVATGAVVVLEEMIPVKKLLVPSLKRGELFLPRRSPEFLVKLFDGLSEEVERQDVIASCESLRAMIEFLLRYFAGVALR